MMSEYTIMSYNIENMKKLFYKGKFHPEAQERAGHIASTIIKYSPHILGIVEASDKVTNHEYFIENTSLSGPGYKIAKSAHRRGKQDLVYYYREPFDPVSLDAGYEFYEPWIEDIDSDGIKEVFEFERKPLEAVFRITGTDIQLMIILVAAKSKGVFYSNDLINHEHLAIANRKKLLAQAGRIRMRVESLLDSDPAVPLIVMGDFNDDPGMDSYERFLGASSVETVMGSIYEPDRILHNALWHITKTDRAKELWTMAYPDLIIRNMDLHRAWLDHIFISPGMLDQSTVLKYVMDSGQIAEKDEAAAAASDHFPVYCTLAV